MNNRNERQIDVFRAEPLAGISDSNVLPQLLSKLTEGEIQQLKVKALEGKLDLELKRQNLQQRLNISQADLNMFEEHIRRLSRDSQGVGSSFKTQGDFETASGRITVTSSKSGCAGVFVIGAIGISGIYAFLQFAIL